MSHFIAAYLLVWLGLLGYLVRLGVRQRRLAKALTRLLDQRSQTPPEDTGSLVTRELRRVA